MGLRQDPLLERSEQHERLEGRAGLAARLSREIELQLGEVLASDHRLDRAVARVDRDERPRRADPVELLAHGLARGALHAQVDRRVHAQAAAVRTLLAVAGDELLLDVLGEVGRHAAALGGSSTA